MAIALREEVASALEELHELWLAEPARTKVTFTEVLGASGVKVIHPGMSRDWARRSPAHRALALSDLEDLEANGLVAIDWGQSKNGRRGELRFTQAGEAFLRRRAAATDVAPTSAGATWHADVLPVLQSIYDLEQTSGEGVSQDQINRRLGRPPGDTATSRTLERLSQAGYLADELTVDQVDGPLSCRLSEKGLQQVAGWPGGRDDLAAQLLAIIEARIDDPEVSEEERGRLVRLRDSIGDVGKGVVAGLLTALIKSQTGL